MKVFFSKVFLSLQHKFIPKISNHGLKTKQNRETKTNVNIVLSKILVYDWLHYEVSKIINLKETKSGIVGT